MPFKYYPIPTPPSSASAILTNDLQALLIEEGAVATDVFDINEEIVFASGSYVSERVRVTGAVDPETGVKLSDDYKRILFYSDINHATSVGKKFYFSENYWITINAENIKSLTASCTVRRTNNQLKWMSGSTVMSEVCIIDYILKNPRDDVPKSALVTPGGYIEIYTQLNSITSTINTGQRFLFGRPGNWTCLKVLGAGLKSFYNLKTLDNNSAQLLTLEVEESFVNNDTDDLVNGIANYYNYTSSGSSSAVNTIVITPSNGDVLEGASTTFDAHYYSGSSIQSGSFVFTVSGSMVPTNHYTFTPLTSNTFSVANNEMYLDNSLDVLCSGSSGSRVFNLTLKGAW